ERALDDAFVRTGTIHFLCASGINVVWLAAIVRGLLYVLGLNYRIAAVLSAVAILAYAGLAEPNPPILRAAVTGSLFFAARAMRRQTRSGNWLAAAVIIVLLLNPSDLFDAGFQFSFGIVAALVFVLPPVVERWTGPEVVEVGGVSIPVNSP